MIRKWSVGLAVVVCLGVLVSCSQLKNDTAITTGNTDEIFSPNTDYDTTSDTTETNNDTTSDETPEIESDTQANGTAAEYEPPLSDEELVMAVNDLLIKEDKSQFEFSFTVVDDIYYLNFGGHGSDSKMVEISNTQSDIYILLIDGSFFSDIAHK